MRSCFSERKCSLRYASVFMACFMAFIKHVERIEVGIFRIDAIRGEASAQAIAAIVHERDGLQNVAAVMARARLVHNTGNGASGGNAHVASRRPRLSSARARAARLRGVSA